MEHRALNYLEHLWPYVSGFFLVVFSAVGLWWKDRKDLKKTIANNVIIVTWIREHMASQDDLRACRKDVDEQDANNLAVVLSEIKEMRADVKQDSRANQAEHREIISSMNQQQIEIVTKMMELHSND